MSAPVGRDVSALCGYALVQRVAQSYLGPLWVAVDQRDGARAGGQALVRHLQLPLEGTSADARRRILQAAEEARALRHENILSTIEVLDEGRELGVVYEYLAAEPLRSLQTWSTMRNLPIPTGMALRIAVDLLTALESLHRTHSSAATFPSFGGLSPDSVLVSTTGETVLCDALVARSAAQVEGIGSNPAKLGFTAPEQLQPGAALTLQSDLFAVGAMLWELLTARRLFIGSREVIERKLRGGEVPKLSEALRGSHLVSPVLVGIVDAALASDPSQRGATAHAMARQLESCGHAVASRHEVAQYVEKLSGQRLERRTASLQSRAAVPRAAPISRPESSIIIGVRPNEASFTPASSAVEASPAPEAIVLTPAAEPEEPFDDVQLESADFGTRSTVVDPAPLAAAPELPDVSAPAAAAPSALATSPARPNRTNAARTMIGIGMPAELVAAARDASPAADQALPPDRSHATPVARGTEAAAHETPVPSSERHAFSLPPAPPDAPSEGVFLRAPVAGRRRNGAKGQTRTRNVALGVIGAAVALGAVALGFSLSSGPDEPHATAPLPVPAEIDAPTAAAARPPADRLPAPSMPERAPAQADETGDTADTDVAVPGTQAEAATDLPGKNFFVAKLEDSQLAEWFALEQQRDLPECLERLGKRNAAKYTGKQTKLSLARLSNAKRALKSGKHETALTELCAATAHDRNNVEAQRNLAELALTLGDAALAKEAAERGLAAAKKKDPVLLGHLGDALALLGDVPGSRKAWLETDTKGSEAQRVQRLAASYRKAGERALASGKLSLARVQLRRVLVLTRASYAPSVDFAQSLLTLEHPRAALAWAERAARALPKNVRAQILLGDAHAANGDHEKARAAWRSALRIQPKHPIASRRLTSSRG